MVPVGPRLFTPEEANALLPRVRPLAERMVALAAELAAAERRRAGLLGHIAGNGGDMPPSELAEATRAAETAAADLARCVERLSGLGVQVKDLELGLVDFPALRGAEEVLLCWKVGEAEVSFWHPADEGFSGRRPLPL